MNKALSVLICLCIGTATVLTAAGCSSLFLEPYGPLTPMTEIGSHNITFVSHTYNLNTGISTWTYNITSGSGPPPGYALSHWAIAWCDEKAIKDASEEWEYVDGKPPTGITGIKFNRGYEDGESRIVWFKLLGNYPKGPVEVATFGGGVANYGSITGPLCETVPQYELTMATEPEIGGTAIDLTDASPYTEGTEVSIKAEPAKNYQFVIWTAPAGEFTDPEAAETTFTMPGQNITVTANFKAKPVPTTYNLTVSSSKGGSATITINPTTVIGPGETTTIYDIPADTVVDLLANPDDSYQFVGWTGTPIDGVTDAVAAITMRGNYDITANFEESPPLPPITVGWDGYPVNKLAVLLPWISLFTVITFSSIILKRRRA